VTDAARATEQEFKNVQEKFNSLDMAVNEASNYDDRLEAIKSRDEYIKSLLEQDATYAQYIEYYQAGNGEIYLTLDADKLKQAVDAIAEAAVHARTGE